jgi:ribosomal protein S18 acetylase RimI-like enzyme
LQDNIPGLEITQVTKVTEDLYQACQQLIPQLTSVNPPPSHHDLELLVNSGSSVLYCARHVDFGRQIIGLATLALYRVPTGLRACIEDVVVDERARGKRIGEALTQACLQCAYQAGAPQVMLTSNPSRIAANRLYQRMGFELRHTNVYRFGLKHT